MAIVVFPNRLVPAADDDDDKWGEESAVDPRSFFLFLALDGLLSVPGRPVPLRLAPCCISGAAQGWLAMQLAMQARATEWCIQVLMSRHRITVGSMQNHMPLREMRRCIRLTWRRPGMRRRRDSSNWQPRPSCEAVLPGSTHTATAAYTGPLYALIHGQHINRSTLSI